MLNKKDLKVLTVDDDHAIRDLMLQSLHNLGFSNITQVADGSIAWSLLLKEKFELLITDWMMPNMDGLELTIAVRSNERLKDLKILMVTSNKDPFQITKAINAGVNEYLLKPFNIESLQEHLTRVLL